MGQSRDFAPYLNAATNCTISPVICFFGEISMPQVHADAALVAADNHDLLTPPEVAKALRVNVATLRIWRSTGRYCLPYIKIGHHVFYRREVIEQVKLHGLKKRGKVRMEGAV
jgi:hypothetical protein